MYEGNNNNHCLLSVDGTDFLGFYTNKTNSSELHYKVALNILTGDICWINGPFLPGEWNDLEIFRSGLMTWLEVFERVEADDGYEGEAPLKVKCPSSIAVPDERQRLMVIVRRRHETVNRRFKKWKILSDVFRHDLGMHGRVFSAIVVISQLAI
jgi:hypothetical protein